MKTVTGPSGTWRTEITIPAHTGYTYELYSSTTLDELDSRPIPFSLTPSGSVANHKFTAASNGALSFYVPLKPADLRRFYSVSYRVPGANTGTP